MGKIVDFNEALKNQPEQEPGMCEHCQIKYDLIDTFMEMLQNTIVESSQDEVGENVFMLVNDFYDEIYDEGKRSAFDDIISFSAYNIDKIDGVEED